MSGLTIIGTGLAGYNLARELRKLNPDQPIRMLTSDDGAFYSKPMISNALAKGKQAADLPMAGVEQMRDDLAAEIITNTTVTSIDPEEHIVTTGTASYDYDKLVLAIGASPIVIPLAGDGAADVLAVNTLSDYRRFRQRIEGQKSIAIMGPGLVGCEFANDLVRAGYSVSVIGPDKAPLGRLLPEQIGHALQSALAEAGVDWHLHTVVTDIDKHNQGYRLQLQNGTTLQADVVLSAVGLHANTQLAELAGLECQRGIVVDRYLATSSKDIYALGDCAQVDGQFLPFVLPIMQCVRALASTLNDKPTSVTYPAMPVLVKTPDYSLIVSPPARGAQGDWVIEEVENGLKGEFRSGDQLLGFALGGEAVALKQALTRQLPPVLS